MTVPFPERAVSCRPRDPTPSRTVALRIFSEVRMHRDTRGQTFVRDRAEPDVWLPYVAQVRSVDVAARVGPPDDAATVAVVGVEVHALPYYAGGRQLLQRLLPVLAALVRGTRGAELCLFRLPGAQSLLAATVARLTRRPYVAEVVGDPVMVLRSGVAGPLGIALAPLCGRLMRWATRGALAVRYETREVLQSLYPPGGSAEAVSYSTVELDDADLTSIPVTPRSGPLMLLAVGSQDQLYKGHDVLIKAVALLCAAGVPVRATVVGGGRHHGALQQLAEEQGVRDQVALVGRVTDRRDLVGHLRAADLFCMPSRTEGLPRALIEAMAAGLPAVGTAVGGIVELLPPDLMVPPGDEVALAELVAALAADPRRRREAGLQNLRTARTYDGAAQVGERRRWVRLVAGRAAGRVAG